MDDLDRAQAIEELHRDHALQKARFTPEEPETDINGNRICLSCGAIIPAPRVLSITAARCVDCQAALEKHNTRYNHAR